MIYKDDPPDEYYKCIKVPLKHILKIPDINLLKITDVVIRSNKIVIYTLLFIGLLSNEQKTTSN